MSEVTPVEHDPWDNLIPVDHDPFNDTNLPPNKLFGTGGAERYQLWPERLARSALDAPHAAMTSETPVTSEEMIPPAQDIAGLAGTSMFGAKPGAGSLGAGPLRKLSMERADQLKRAEDLGFTTEAYHSTKANAFERFKRNPDDIGIHFGTVGQAEDRLFYKVGDTPVGHILPVRLKIKNPLRLGDAGTWGAEEMHQQLTDHPEFKNDLQGHNQFLEEIAKKYKDESGPAHSWWWDVATDAEKNQFKDFGLQNTADYRKLIQSKGYDSIVYKNRGETAGAAPLTREVNFKAQKLQDIQKLQNYTYDQVKTTPEWLDWKMSENRLEAHRWNKAEDSYAVFHPNQVRSQFAQFDPAKVRSGNLLYSGGVPVPYQDIENHFKVKVQPIEHDPWSILHSVDHDPFEKLK